MSNKFEQKFNNQNLEEVEDKVNPNENITPENKVKHKTATMGAVVSDDIIKRYSQMKNVLELEKKLKELNPEYELKYTDRIFSEVKRREEQKKPGVRRKAMIKSPDYKSVEERLQKEVELYEIRKDIKEEVKKGKTEDDSRQVLRKTESGFVINPSSPFKNKGKKKKREDIFEYFKDFFKI